MKATELMIGDWVGRVFDDKRIIEDYRQVDWIRTGEIGMRYRKVWSIGCIEPIRLTPEILEKNGWYYGLTSDEEEAEYSLDGCHYHRHWSYDEGAGSISLIFPNEADGGELIIDDQSFNRHLNLVFCDTLHVHELQRALRLCGFDELADNFKV